MLLRVSLRFIPVFLQDGWHQNVVGKTNCKVCGVRMFQPNHAQEWCINCPAGWKTIRDSTDPVDGNPLTFHQEPHEDGRIANWCSQCPHSCPS